MKATLSKKNIKLVIELYIEASNCYTVNPLIGLRNRYKSIFGFLLTNIDKQWFVSNVWSEIDRY